MPRDDIRRKIEAVTRLAHAVVHVVILGAAQTLVVKTHAVIDFAAIERVGQRIDIARFSAVAERRCAAAEARGIQRARDGFPGVAGVRADDASADDILSASQRVEIFLQKILWHARVRVQPDDCVARRGAQRYVDATGQPALGIFEQLYLERRALGKAAHDLRGIVRRGAVYQQGFQLTGIDGLCKQIAQQRVEALRGVVGDDNKADFCHREVSRFVKWSVIPPRKRGCVRGRSPTQAAGRRRTAFATQTRAGAFSPAASPTACTRSSSAAPARNSE